MASKNNKVGIFTWHFFTNFGSALQAYAMQESINDLGYKGEIIDYRGGKRNGEIFLLKSFISKFYKPEIRSYKFIDFQKKYFNMSRCVLKRENLKKASRKYKAIVAGSDQIWAPSQFNSTYFLDFFSGKKISYAASIGLEYIPSELCSQYQSLLFDFSSVMVREHTAKDLLFKNCDISSQVVLDPTMLISADNWKKLEKSTKHIESCAKKPFVFCYLLNKEHRYRELIENYAKKENLKIIGWSLNENDSSWMENLSKEIGPQEFLWLISRADTVITDSYHGTIFSLLYHKKFITLERFKNDSPICQNSRIYQLDKYFGIKENIVCADVCDELNVVNIKYTAFEEKLALLRKNSTTLLKNALEE